MNFIILKINRVKHHKCKTQLCSKICERLIQSQFCMTNAYPSKMIPRVQQTIFSLDIQLNVSLESRQLPLFRKEIEWVTQIMYYCFLHINVYNFLTVFKHKKDSINLKLMQFSWDLAHFTSRHYILLLLYTLKEQIFSQVQILHRCIMISLHFISLVIIPCCFIKLRLT